MQEYLKKGREMRNALANTKNQISMGTTIRNNVERSEQWYPERTPQRQERKKTAKSKGKDKGKGKGKGAPINKMSCASSLTATTATHKHKRPTSECSLYLFHGKPFSLWISTAAPTTEKSLEKGNYSKPWIGLMEMGFLRREETDEAPTVCFWTKKIAR